MVKFEDGQPWIHPTIFPSTALGQNWMCDRICDAFPPAARGLIQQDRGKCPLSLTNVNLTNAKIERLVEEPAEALGSPSLPSETDLCLFRLQKWLALFIRSEE